jgi:hypothetical protein
MKDKEMIEEMAKIIDDRLIEANNYLGSMNKGEGYWIAQKLVEHYRPKIPEDSVVINGSKLAKLVEEVRQEFEHEYKDKVVLDKEEYNKVEDTFKMSISDHIAYLRENKRLKEDVQALIGMRFERFNLITQEESDKKVEQARKETAEKILKEIDKELYNISRLYLESVTKNGKDDDAINNYGVMSIAHDVVVKVAKQFGVEIKE